MVTIETWMTGYDDDRKKNDINENLCKRKIFKSFEEILMTFSRR